MADIRRFENRYISISQLPGMIE